jgi:hypothetical protein
MMTLNTLKRVEDIQYNAHPPLLRRHCTPNTRQQILQQLMEWARDDTKPRVYWLSGMAGTGKTTIAYSFCEQLEAEGLLGASFFCSRTIDESREVRAVFPSIAHELAERFVILPSKLIGAVEQDKRIASRPLDKQLAHLILEPANPGIEKRHIIALDGFDEFKTIDDARILLTSITNSASKLPNLKFFITSRQEPQLEEVFKRPGVEGITSYLHNIEESMVRGDIELYLVERREEICKAKGLAETWWTDEQLQRLLDRAGKLFIYASTTCSFLETSDAEECKGLLDAILDRHSLGQHDHLDRLYSQVLNAIQQDHRRKEIIKDVLWVAVAALNPLHIPTITALLKKSDDVAVYTALKRLGAVITVPMAKDVTDIPVLPFHASFPDFLHDKNRSSTHYISEIEAHHFMMGLCLNVLGSSPVLKRDICDIGQNNGHISSISPSSLEKISKDLEYSSIYWLVHLGHILDSEDLKESEVSQVLSFFDTDVLHWIECMALLGKLKDASHSLRQIELSPKVRHL